MSSIYVRGFDFGTDEDALRRHFKGIGDINDVYFQGRGDAVITYADASSAGRAVDELHQSHVDGQSRYVDVYEGEGKGKGKGKGSKGSKGGGAPGRTIFVAGFDFETDDDALTRHFEAIGEIEAFHFQSKSSAVITYASSSAADRAVSELDGSTMSGQRRYVDVRMDGADRGGFKGKGYSGGDKGFKGGGKGFRDNGGDGTGRAIYASGFDYSTDSATLEDHFGTVGTIDDIRFQGSGGAVITFTNAATAQRAVEELDGSTMRGQTRYVAVKIDGGKGRKGSGKGSW